MKNNKKSEDKKMKTLKYDMPENLKHNCPICGRENNYRFGDVCDHVDRVTAKSKIIYLIPVIERRYNSKYSQNINIR